MASKSLNSNVEGVVIAIHSNDGEVLVLDFDGQVHHYSGIKTYIDLFLGSHVKLGSLLGWINKTSLTYSVYDFESKYELVSK